MNLISEELIEIPSILCDVPEHTMVKDTIENFYDNHAFSDVENILGYQFRQKAYLIAAFTHPSNFANRLTKCYERLSILMFEKYFGH